MWVAGRCDAYLQLLHKQHRRADQHGGDPHQPCRTQERDSVRSRGPCEGTDVYLGYLASCMLFWASTASSFSAGTRCLGISRWRCRSSWGYPSRWRWSARRELSCKPQPLQDTNRGDGWVTAGTWKATEFSVKGSIGPLCSLEGLTRSLIEHRQFDSANSQQKKNLIFFPFGNHLLRAENKAKLKKTENCPGYPLTPGVSGHHPLILWQRLEDVAGENVCEGIGHFYWSKMLQVGPLWLSYCVLRRLISVYARVWDSFTVFTRDDVGDADPQRLPA